MEKKYTPGPWERGGKQTKDGGNPYYVYCDNALGTAVANCNLSFTGNLSQEEKIANAQLIATSPDLLEALEAFIDCFQSENGWVSDAVANKAKLAINKAYGKQSRKR